MRPALAIAAAAAAVAGLAWWSANAGDGTDTTDETGNDEPADMTPSISDELQAAAASMTHAVMATPASGMYPSTALLDMIRRSERLMLTAYWLGDGGWTIGYGHFTRAADQSNPPKPITADQAEAMLADDIESRGARWVRTYVTVDLTQQQFDALTHMAYNLSPKSFRQIADAVNAGDDPEGAAMRFLGPAATQRGVRNRRLKELALYREGVYA